MDENKEKDISILNKRLRLQSSMSRMKKEDRDIIIKISQFSVLSEIAELISYSTSASSEQWETVIRKLKNLKGMKTSDGFDFDSYIDEILPKIGKMVGTFSAISEIEKKRSEVESYGETEHDCVKEDDSVVLSMCRNKEKGFSL